jgi:TonB family protein
MNPKQSMDYAKAIVGFLEKFCHNCQLPALAGVLENRSQMKRRIAKIVQYRKTSLTLTFTAVILFVSAGFLLFTLTGVAAEKRMISPGMEMASIESSGHVSAVRTGDVKITPEGFHDDAHDTGNEVMVDDGFQLALQFEASPAQLPEGPMLSSQNETLRPVRGASDEDKEDAVHAAEAVPERFRAVFTDASVAKSSKMAGTHQLSDPGPMASEQPMTSGSNEPGAEGVGAVVASETRQTYPERSPVSEVSRGEPAQAFRVAGDGGMVHEQAGTITPEESVSQLHSVDNFQARLEGNKAPGYDLPENERKHPNSVAVSAAIEMMERDSGEMPRDFASSTPMTAKQGGSGAATAFRAAEVDTPPRLIKSYSPRYPYMAKRDDISGSIILQFVVTKEGDVVNTTVVQSDPKGVFDQAALRAIEHYRFKPGTKDGEAVDVKVNLPIKFNLS